MNIQIRKATESDKNLIASFQVKMALETENLQLDPKLVDRGVDYFFRNPESGFYLVAEKDKCVVACLLIQNEWSDWRNCFVWWIHSVYVIPEERQNGIFKQMYRYLQQEVERSPELGGLRLFVDKSNVRAQEVYRKMGMNGDHYQLFEWMIR